MTTPSLVMLAQSAVEPMGKGGGFSSLFSESSADATRAFTLLFVTITFLT